MGLPAATMFPIGAALILPIAAAFCVGLVFGAFVIGAMRMRRHTRRVTTAARELLEPTLDGHVPVDLPDGALRQVFERLAAVATIDPLTGVLNRQRVLGILEEEVARSARYRRPLSVGLVDLDHFKSVNDTFGHPAGDVLLHHVAQLLRANLRRNDSVGRYGGEEFLLILPETDPEAAVRVAEKLRRIVGRSEVRLADGTPMLVTLSVGVTGGAGPARTLVALTREADAALYTAKSLGRDQVYLFRDVDDERLIPRTAVTSAARSAANEIGRRAAEAAVAELLARLGARPVWAGGLSEGTAELSVRLARAMRLPDAEVARVRTACLFHDVGKLALPDALSSRAERPSRAERDEMTQHPELSYIVLDVAGGLRDTAAIALHHHEWWNGQGYPHGLAGTDIPLGARILAITDAFEAMTVQRPQRQARSRTAALEEICRRAGVQFDPQLVEVFAALIASGDVPAHERAVTEHCATPASTT